MAKPYLPPGRLLSIYGASAALGLGIMALTGCGDSDSDIALDDGLLQWGDKRLALGTPVDLWRASLGPGHATQAGGVLWHENKILGLVRKNACGTALVTGVRLSLNHAQDSLPENSGLSLRLEACVFHPTVQLSGEYLECSAKKENFAYRLIRFDEFDSFHPAYATENAGLKIKIGFRPDQTPTLVEYSLSSDNLNRLGVDLKEERAKAFLDSGFCQNPPMPQFAAPLHYPWRQEFRHAARRFLRDLFRGL